MLHILTQRDKIWLARPGEVARHAASLPKGIVPGSEDATMNRRQLPQWRSAQLLYVPASEERFVAKAPRTRRGCEDLFDLEDGVRADAKARARAGLAASAGARTAEWRGCCRRAWIARCGWRPRILRPAAAAGADGLICTKMMGADHVRLLSELATESEVAGGRAVGSLRFHCV
jgi:citrate lyase subunit beta/citryl-CoA lyase